MKKEQEQEFDRIVDLLISQGDVHVLTDLIKDAVKIQFIKDWNDECDHCWIDGDKVGGYGTRVCRFCGKVKEE